MTSIVNRPITNRHLIDGWPAGQPTSPTKINRQTNQKRPSLLDVYLFSFVFGRLSWKMIFEIPYFAKLKICLYII